MNPTMPKIRFLSSLVLLFLLSGCISEKSTAFTKTPSVTYAAVTSIIPSPIPAFTGTPGPTDTEASDNQLNLSLMNVQEWVSTSLDGKWIAVGLVAFPKENVGGQLAYVRLAIFSADGKAHWVVIDNEQEMGPGFPIPEPLRWSPDHMHFYFTHRVIPDGCSTFPFLTDLQQVDLSSGRVTELLPQSARTLALAPDELQVAYVGYGERGLVLRNLATKEERKVKIDPGQDFDVGNIVWSPDGNSLVLTLAINPCTGVYGISKTVWAESTSILWVDVETLRQKVLIDDNPSLFVTLEWNEPEKITIVDGEENGLWYLDVNTGEITRK